jgi:hypothetical protein
VGRSFRTFSLHSSMEIPDSQAKTSIEKSALHLYAPPNEDFERPDKHFRCHTHSYPTVCMLLGRNPGPSRVTMPVPGLQGGRVAGFCRVERAVCSQIPIAFATGPFIGRARTVMPSKECTLRPTIYNICGKTPTPELYKSTLTPEHTNKPKSVKQNGRDGRDG